MSLSSDKSLIQIFNSGILHWTLGKLLERLELVLSPFWSSCPAMKFHVGNYDFLLLLTLGIFIIIWINQLKSSIESIGTICGSLPVPKIVQKSINFANTEETSDCELLKYKFFLSSTYLLWGKFVHPLNYGGFLWH